MGARVCLASTRNKGIKGGKESSEGSTSVFGGDKKQLGIDFAEAGV